MTKPKPLENMSFEDALGELESVVRSLESGNTPLAQSVEAYERGIALQKLCETRLREAQSKIEKITIAKDGTLNTEPLDKE